MVISFLTVYLEITLMLCPFVVIDGSLSVIHNPEKFIKII